MKTPREELILAILAYKRDTRMPLPKILKATLEWLDSGKG